MAEPRTPEPRATPADIAEMARYATESRPPIVDTPALRELEEATTCHCDVAWTSRNLHGAHCLGHLRSEVEALYRAGVQAGREQEIQRARAAHRGGHDNTLSRRYQDGWEAGYIVGRADGRDEGEAAGREAAAQALLACALCGQIHPWRETRDGGTYAAPDGHPWHPAATDADGPEALATIARGQAPPEVCPATTDLYGADIPCARSPGHRDPHQSHNPILTWGEDWRYEDAQDGDADG